MVYQQAQPRPTPKQEDEGPFIPPHPSEFGLEYNLDEEEMEGMDEDEMGDEKYDSEGEDYQEDEPRPVPPPQPRAMAAPPLHDRDSELHKLRPYQFRPSKQEWKHIPTSGIKTNQYKRGGEYKKPCYELRIITWNIDFNSDRHEERLDEALLHIEDILRCKEDREPEPCCILFQEVHAEVLPYLLENEWVRRWFVVTPHRVEKWPRGQRYGNVTLVARSLDIAECHILHFGPSAMGRTALCVNIKLHYPGTDEKAVIAVVNTHLESLTQESPVRPKQLDLCSRFLRRMGVNGGVIAGDMNSIGREDAMIGKNLGLKDSWRKGDVEAGHTWGYQGNEGFPNARLDKIFYLPGMSYKVDEPKRIGVGLKIQGDSDAAMWVSDHYGLETTLRMLKPRSNSS